MRFPFDPNKAAQATAYLASLHEGQISLFLIMKLIYLADREALIEIGRPITGDQPVNMNKGGAPSGTYDALKQETEEDILDEPWSKYLERAQECYKFRPAITPPDTDDLSPYELGILKRIHDKFGWMSSKELLIYMHSLQEWSNPHGSSSLVDPSDILRFANKSQKEIEEIGRMAEESYYLSTLARFAS